MRKLFSLFVALFATTALWAYDIQVGDLYYNITMDGEVGDEITEPNEGEVEVTNGDYSSLVSASIPSSISYEGITYKVIAIGKEAFINCSSLTSITIPNSVTSIGGWAFAYCDSLTSIVIPNSVTSIGYCAFSSCSSLNGIDIPNGVTRIGCNAFSYCTSLTFIKIPESVVLIENGDGFPSHNNIASGTPNLKSIIVDPNNLVYDSREGCNAVIETATNKLICGCQNTFIPNSVASIGYVAFYDCTTLTSIDIPSTVKSIKEGAFHNTGIDSVYIPAETIVEDWKSSMVEWFGAFSSCQNLTNITFAEGIKRIPAGVIAYCPNIRSVHIPSSVTSIGGQAFRHCTSLTSVTIPESVTSIGNCAFDGCSSLTTMVVEASNPTFDSRENCNAIIETATNTLIAGCQSTVIPNSVTSIGWSAFISCTSISSITIPESVTSIGGQAFFGCSSLTSITIPESVTSIGKSAFSRCSSLTSITIPNSVTSIGDYAFIDCTSLTSITCKATTPPTLGLSVFPSELTTAYIPCGTKSAYEASDWASQVSEFVENCVDPTWQITYTSTDGNIVTPYKTDVFGANIVSNIYQDGQGAITFDGPVTSIGNEAFDDCSSLTSITIPNSVTSIRDWAFDNCSSLTSVTIPNSVTSIGYAAFRDCSSLTSITIPESVTSIEYHAFEGCSSLTSITIPNSVTSIGGSAFAYCDALTSITLGSGVIGNHTFKGCTSLTSITLGSGVKSIAEWAFEGCSSLASITIPEGVIEIGYAAFYGCTHLTSITCEATTPPTLGSSVFPSELTTAYIPCSTKEAYEASDWAQYVSEFVEDCYSNQKCGDNLFWKYNDTQLSITGHGDMYDYDIEPQPWMQYRSKMQTISMPEGMTSIGASAFANCKYVKSIAIPASVEKISDSAFEDCRMLSTITFAGSSVLTHIGNWAFYNNHELTSITIPEGVIEIGYAAFYGCTYLDELTLPASMEYIADNGFALCAKLRRINVNASTPPDVEARTFEDVDRSIPVYVPNTSIELYKAAPVWQEFNIVGKNNTTTDVDNIHSPITNYHKLIRNGQLIIIRDGKTYNIMGQEL